ncbi:ABC transporter substrate-binding protein [Sinanaerobacter chloroacetimidivorans]|uniref:ABC transporter substrate-binding protein n=1 Tax=Sinanaerobacter chloroacetimidivorans TaxID=2818044 RepID=A0A8J7VX68_9FIRM|nr:ABC transporter substrate-binding protein [Sinanaerobacter chloroacetimidivorans]MBR0596699.1 ABC transporter substrate-binding protein [Sinanaerobacter chloroacetimidivorans]
MLKKFIAIGTAVLIAASGLTGCGETTSFLGGNPEEKVETVTSSEIYIPIEKIRTLNPVIAKDEDAYYINKLIYDGLFGFNENLGLVSQLADSYSYSQDGSSVTLNLKRGILWHDGQEVTADDVKFSIEAYINASYTNVTLYTSYVQNISSVKLVKNDPYQLEVYFKQNNQISLENFTFPIIPKHKFKSLDATRTASEGFIPVGTGAYRVVDINELSHIILKGNENYHGGYTPKNTLHFQIMPDKVNAINLMEVNNISLTYSKEIDRDTIYTNKDVNVVPFPSNEVELIGFNFRNNALVNKKVRQAIACAIDTQEILEAGYFKNGMFNDNIYYPNFLGVASSENNYKFDITRAKALLTEAGYIDRNGDGLVENALNEEVSINILVNAEDQSRIAAAEIIKKGLDKLPIRSNIITKDWNGYQSDLASGNFDIYLGGYQIKETYDMRPFLHTGFGNVIGYSNPALDLLLDKMESGISVKDRASTYTKIKDILTDDLPYFCLLYKTYGAIASPSLQGEIKPYFNNLYHGCEKWFNVYEIPADKNE